MQVLPSPADPRQQQRLVASSQLLENGLSLCARDVGIVDQRSPDPPDIGRVTIVDARPNLAARCDWLLDKAVLIQLVYHVVRCDGLCEPIPCEFAQAESHRCRVCGLATDTLDERGDSLLNKLNEFLVSNGLEVTSPKLPVCVARILSAGRDVIVERLSKLLGQ